MAWRAERIDQPALRPLLTFPVPYFAGLAVLGAIVVLGLYVWAGRQLTTGLGVTGMSNQLRWGLYIVNFVFFIGLSAGGIIVAALANILGLERYRPVSRIAELMSISCLVIAAVFIGVDLGRPDRAINLFRFTHWTSPLVWDVMIITTYLLMALALGYFGTRKDLVYCMETLPGRRSLYKLLTLGYTDVSPKALARDRRILLILSWAAIPGAVGLHSVTAWILGLVKAQAGWHSSILAPLFIVSAVTSGLALLIVSVILGRYLFRLAFKDQTIHDLGRLLTVMIPVLAYFLFAEIITVSFAREKEAWQVFTEVVSGTFAPIFWFLIIAGLAAPFLILLFPQALAKSRGLVAANPRLRALPLTAGAVAIAVLVSVNRGDVFLAADQTPSFPITLGLAVVIVGIALVALLLASPSPVVPVGVAAALVVLAVFGERSIIVLPSLTTPLLPYPKISYMPTGEEWAITLGAYALGALAFAVIAKVIPLLELEEAATQAPEAPPGRRWAFAEGEDQERSSS